MSDLKNRVSAYFHDVKRMKAVGLPESLARMELTFPTKTRPVAL